MPRKSAATPAQPEQPAPVVEAASAPDATAPAQPPVAPPPSVLDRVRDNRMGPLAVGLGVAVVVGLLLSTLVPKDASALALILLGALVTAAVGFTVRYLTRTHGLISQVVAFVATVFGVHLMAVAGAVNGAGGGSVGGGMLGGLLSLPSAGFNEALIAAMAVPAFSAGTIFSGVVAAIIVGWGPAGDDAR